MGASSLDAIVGFAGGKDGAPLYEVWLVRRQNVSDFASTTGSQVTLTPCAPYSSEGGMTGDTTQLMHNLLPAVSAAGFCHHMPLSISICLNVTRKLIEDYPRIRKDMNAIDHTGRTITVLYVPAHKHTHKHKHNQPKSKWELPRRKQKHKACHNWFVTFVSSENEDFLIITSISTRRSTVTALCFAWYWACVYLNAYVLAFSPFLLDL